MKQLIIVICLIGTVGFLKAQKKPLDHTVYDSWQSISERLLSNDGKYIAFTVNPQEGDGDWILSEEIKDKSEEWKKKK